MRIVRSTPVKKRAAVNIGLPKTTKVSFQNIDTSPDGNTGQRPLRQALPSFYVEIALGRGL
jgi:hypothetical protein